MLSPQQIKILNWQEIWIIWQRKEGDAVHVDYNYYPSIWWEARVELNRHAHRNAQCDTINHDEPSIQFLMIAGI